MQPILKVDLSEQKTDIIEIPPPWEEAFLGGASLAARLLYEHLHSELDPFAPEAPLLFLNGPLSGTAGPAVGRFVVCGRSPATRLWAESNCGGFWGVELRQAGFDGLWITGQASEPVYLWIRDDQVQIRPAAHLWGLETYAVQQAVAAELNSGKVRVACIGPAGEALVPFALILCDHGRVAGRTGLGAVMGAKRLKAIAVRGQRTIPLADPERYAPLRSEANRQLRSDPVIQVLHELGTSGAAEYFDYLGEMPKHYFQRGTFDEPVRTTGATMKESILAGVSACHACVIACGRVVRLEDGARRKGPEYETLVGFGPNLGLNDPTLATQLGELCDRLGMDTISMSGTLGLAYHLFNSGRLTATDTEGRELRFGDASQLPDLIRQTAYRQGFGALLALGSRQLGQHFNAEEEAVQVNGLEVAYHDPRGSSGMALVYATSPRGACHNQSDYFLVDIGQSDPLLGVSGHDRLAGAEKAGSVAAHQNWRTVFNSLVMCLFANLPPEKVLELVNAACGYQWELADLLRCGERGWNLKRLINRRLGLRKVHDTLPPALQRPYSDNPPGLENVAPDLPAMLDEYYRQRGWDPATGFPTAAKLAELGLEWAAGD